jgi:hypothetical protein
MLLTSTFPAWYIENFSSTHVTDALTIYIYIYLFIYFTFVLSFLKLNILTSPQKTHNFTSTRMSITCFYNFS